MEAYSFTAREVRDIDAAWVSLTAHLDCCGHSDRYELEEAFKAEKKHLQGLRVEARALTLKTFLDGLQNPDRPARYLSGLRTSWVQAFLLGARTRGVAADLITELSQARTAYDLAQARYFNRARAGIAQACVGEVA